MRTFGLTGYPLAHSFSAEWFGQKFAAEGIADAQYLDFPVEEASMLPALLARGDILGLNVTIPYKERIIPLLDELSPDAAAIGAVNCVVRRGGKLIGHNTDWEAFGQSLADFLPETAAENNIEALILGSGGASKAAAYALDRMGIEHITVSRNRGGARAEHGSHNKSSVHTRIICYGDIGQELIGSHKLIINATPLGMFPLVEGRPEIPYEWLTPGHILYDMVYNPPLTLFLAEGQQRGCRIKNGLEMLHRQAELSWEIFSGEKISQN